MPFTPTSFTSPDGSETLVAETWSEYYQLLWEGWSPGGPAPTTPPFTVRELDYLNDGYVKIPQDIEPGQTLIWDGLTLQPGDLGSISGDFATLDESGKIAQSAVPDLSAEYAVVDENGHISTAAVPPLPYATLDEDGKLLVGEVPPLPYVEPGELVLNAADYGLVGDDATVNDLTALNAALNSALRPSAVYWPPGIYRLSQPLAAVSFVRHYGATMGNTGASNPRSVLKWTSGSAIVPGAAQTLTGLTFENLALIAAGSHLIDLTGTTGGMTFSRFSRCHISLAVATASFMKTADTVSNLFDLKFEGNKFERLSTHTVPAFDISTSKGTSHLKFDGGWWHSFGCSSTPFFRADYTGSGGGMYGFEFINLIGEQNAGGMIHLSGIKGARIENVVDTDQSALAASYADDVFKIAVGSGGAASWGVRVERSGITDGTLAAGKRHLNISSGTAHYISTIRNGVSDSSVSAPINGRVWQHEGGWARSLRTAGSDYIILTTDDVVMLTAGSHTFTLPDPTLVPYGRAYTLKNNTTGSVLTVASAGIGQVDNAGTAILSAGAKSTYISNGVNWYAI